MTILEKLDEKISYLKRNSQDELNRISSVLEIINSSILALSDEQKFKNYDFSIAINLVNSNSFGLIDLEKIIRDAKNVLTAKYDYKQIYLSLSEEHKEAIKSFKERLGFLKEEFERRLEELSKIKIDEKTLESLEDFKTLLEGKGRRKYYTYEMIESLFEVVDYNAFSYEDMEELIKGLAVSKNIKGKLIEDEKDIADVISLLEEYLSKSIKIGYLSKYQHEICSRIDLVNARNILEFFKTNNILNRFSPVSLIPIIVYGKFDYIKEFYYEKVIPKDDKIKELYFSDAMSCVWINENSTKRRRNLSIKKNREKDNNKSLLSTISEVCDDDIWENIRLLKENEDILSEKYDLSNIDYLWVITKPTWLIKKNFELFRMFNVTNIKLSALIQNDLEDKMHFIIELGLLNTPRTYVFREVSKTVPKYNEFMINGQRKRHHDDNILNYFSRNTSEIGLTSYTEYIYWFYKMQRSGKEEFYQNFFSSYKAGQRNKSEFYSEDEKSIISDSEQMEKIIADNFVINYYDALISNYDVYSEVIKEYAVSEKGDIVVPYYDNNILNDEMISKLEEHIATDIYSTDGEIRKVHNPYVYVFDKNIISRYKVLRNLSILKHRYGYLNDDMILTSVVYNSYIDKDTFDRIKNSIKREVNVK